MAEINVIITILARAVIIIAVITKVTKMQINDEMFVCEMTSLHYFRLL
jgi:hypothetical protein